TENFPWPAEIDNHRAVRDKKGNRDTALDRGLERICYDRWFVTIASIRSSDRIRTGGKFTNRRKRNCRHEAESDYPFKQFAQRLYSFIHEAVSRSSGWQQ